MPGLDFAVIINVIKHPRNLHESGAKLIHDMSSYTLRLIFLWLKFLAKRPLRSTQNLKLCKENVNGNQMMRGNLRPDIEGFSRKHTMVDN